MSVTVTTTAGNVDGVNMSNRNARPVLESLGIEGDDLWCGSMDAQEFLGRVLMALAVAPTDEGLPEHEWEGASEFGFGRFIDAGREPGYLQARLERLHEVAAAAVADGLQVVWS